MTLNSDFTEAPVLPAKGPPPIDRRGAIRSLFDSFISLFIAVLLFRTFAAEGYMISTGSMAPCLLGFHKRVECPTCKHNFAFGVAYDTDAPAEAEELMQSRTRAVCPNCGQPGIDLSQVPRNHGDQLLVNKQAYFYRTPNRWEIIVFRNPAKPTEAYVKRVAGLPSERLQIENGDIVIDGKLARKTYEQQRAMRILVHDHNHRPKRDPAFQPHWRPTAELAVDMREAREPAGWKEDGDGFVLDQGHERRPDQEPYRWIEYRHWIRFGGLHDTSVILDEWPPEIQPSSVPQVGLRYDPQAKTLSCTGALPEPALREILTLSENPIFRAAMRQLYEYSHIAPVTDEYGYNPVEGGTIPTPVRDVMVSCRLHIEGGAGEFAIQMTDGVHNYACLIDASKREVRLLMDDSEPLTTAEWPKALDKGTATVEMSLIDQQIILAIDGQPVLTPWLIETPAGTPVTRTAARLGGRGLDVRVDQLKLYRDVYYTTSRSRNGVNRPYLLADDEYFVLGDNSPVSHDSRRWDEAPVHRSLLLGKPFLVHLPSMPGRLKIGNHEMHLRLPDTERIRFLK